MVKLLVLLFLKLLRGFSFIYHIIYPYHYLILSHYIISSWSAKAVKSQTITTYATHSFVLVDFYCFCYVSFSFLRDSKFSGEFYGKMFLRSKTHYLKFRGELNISRGTNILLQVPSKPKINLCDHSFVTFGPQLFVVKTYS